VQPEVLVKIKFLVQRDADGYPPADIEWLWARRVGENVYQIDNIPFFAKLTSLGDKVMAEKDQEGNLSFKEHVSYSRHCTLRVVAYEEEDVAEVRDVLKKMGCPSELSHIPKLIAVDVPPDANFIAVLEFLNEGEKRGVLEYEEAAVWGRDQ